MKSCALALLALFACAPYTPIGREVADAAIPPLRTLFIAPEGSDATGDGTLERPWRTFAHVIPMLRPGDHLLLKDGTYTGSTTGYPFIVCGTNAVHRTANAAHGTAEHPIAIRAQNERRAFLKGDGIGQPFYLSGCGYWIVEGLRAEGADVPSEGGDERGSVFSVTHSSHHVVLRRLLGSKPNRHWNAMVILVTYGSHDVLVEESEAYDFHFLGFCVFEAGPVEMRRNYANGRGYADLPGGYPTFDPQQGDYGFIVSGGRDSLFENNVAERVAYGFSVQSATPPITPGLTVSGTQFFGNVALEAVQAGFHARSTCAGQNPCRDSSLILDQTEMTNNVALRCGVGFESEGGRRTSIAGGSVIDARRSGVVIASHPSNAGLAATTYVARTSVVTAESFGFELGTQSDWRIEDCNVFGAKGGGYPVDARVLRSTSIDPKLGLCTVYPPAGSPLRGAAGGADIGASIVFRSERGRPTAHRLWSRTTGAFPCGTIVPGINDRDFDSCFSVHRRIGIGPPACPLP